MIPWDYNLAFGTFQGGNASSSVNASIDSPVSGSLDDRPMVGWIFSDETYTEKYHELFAEFIEKWFTNGELEKLIDDTAEMLRSYVKKDPTKFCTTEEFDTGVETLKQFVSLRAEAVSRQLSGDNTAVETGSLNLSAMGSMGGGGGMKTPGSRSDSESSTPSIPDQSSSGKTPADSETQSAEVPEASQPDTAQESSAQAEESTESGRKSGQSQQRPGSSSFSGGTPSGSSKGLSSSASFWILTGISVIILGAGLFIVIKRKSEPYKTAKTSGNQGAAGQMPCGASFCFSSLFRSVCARSGIRRRNGRTDSSSSAR